MKPEEIIELLKGMQSPLEDYAELVGAPAFTYGHKYVYPYPEDYAIEEAIKALEEVQQYRENGSVKECKEMASIVKKSERSELANIIDEWIEYRKIGTVEECKEMAVIANKKTNPDELAKIIVEWIQYNKIGTVEECRKAVEKQKAKELVYESDSVFSNGFSHYRMGKCPMCDRYYNSSDEVNYCSKCGQALMNENLEGMEE